MEVSLEYLGDSKFKANSSKSSFIMDCKEITPVEYFALGTIGCTGIDLVTMAKNDGFEVKNYSVKAQIQRATQVPVKFNTMHIIYKFDGTFDELKAKRYILASLESYCTTVNSIRDSVKIEYSIIYNGKNIANQESILSGTSSKSSAFELEDGFGGACCS